MKLSKFQLHPSEIIVTLFRRTFSDSEGVDEGESIGELVQTLIDTTSKHDLFGYCAEDGGALVGCIFFSRFSVPVEGAAFMLSPVAVSTQHQRKGIGQALINFGLNQIRLEGVELVVTYGDPKYYSKVGFESISEDVISSPYSLTYPQGWQAQSLISAPLLPIQGKTECVEAFRSQEYW